MHMDCTSMRTEHPAPCTGGDRAHELCTSPAEAYTGAAPLPVPLALETPTSTCHGDWVVSDRFLMSNIVYQGHAGGLDIEAIREAGEIATCGIQPDLTLVLDIDLDTASVRMNRPLDRLESRGEDYHQKVRNGYHIEAQSEDAVLIDATADTDKVRTEIIAVTQSTFSNVLNCSLNS